MRDTKRTGQTQFKALLSMSHSGTHSCTRGHRTAASQMFCPVDAHSPTAEVSVQQVRPNQLHFRALLSRISFPLIYKPTTLSGSEKSLSGQGPSILLTQDRFAA